MNIDQLSINTIRTLSIDAIEKANSGHPGMVMGAAPAGYMLWRYHIKQNPCNPKWINRDRFVLSAGHGSMMLYSLLHLSGYNISIEDIKNFRQWGSKTPGHPEYGCTEGVDATTGPLGQGFGMAVGMAIAEAHLSKLYNRDNYPVVDHFTYVICGDGDIMEGITAEAASLAGHLGLGKLIVLYDSNDVCLDGELSATFSEDVHLRFKSYGWQVLHVGINSQLKDIDEAISKAKEDTNRPTLIEIKSIIGEGSPNKSGKSISHGSPLGAIEAKLAKQNYEWGLDQQFYVPDEVKEHFKNIKMLGMESEKLWLDMIQLYKNDYPDLYKQFISQVDSTLPEDCFKSLPSYKNADISISPRNVSHLILNEIANKYNSLIGGSADLASSNMTTIKNSNLFSKNDYTGRNLAFGVREFAMGAISNGISLHQGLRPFCATFLVFSDYLKPAIRLAAIMKLPIIYVFTHDSVSIGPDGPTHQPVEQLQSLRAIPNMTVIRPADAEETVDAWKIALLNDEGPTAIILARHEIPVMNKYDKSLSNAVAKGAYILSDNSIAEDLSPQIQIISTGSEVSLALEAQKRLSMEGILSRIVSMPSCELFEKQTDEYKKSVILPNVKCIAIEMGSSHGWYKYVGDKGMVMGVDEFGHSAPSERILEEFGFTVERVISKIKMLIQTIR